MHALKLETQMENEYNMLKTPAGQCYLSHLYNIFSLSLTYHAVISIGSGTVHTVHRINPVQQTVHSIGFYTVHTVHRINPVQQTVHSIGSCSAHPVHPWRGDAHEQFAPRHLENYAG